MAHTITELINKIDLTFSKGGSPQIKIVQRAYELSPDLVRYFGKDNDYSSDFFAIVDRVDNPEQEFSLSQILGEEVHFLPSIKNVPSPRGQICHSGRKCHGFDIEKTRKIRKNEGCISRGRIRLGERAIWNIMLCKILS